MNALLSYFLQAGICSGMLYGYYHFFLRNKRLHQYNRFYLLGTVLLSLLLPLLNIPVYFTNAEKESSVVLNTLIDLSPASFSPVTTDVPIITDRAAGTDLFTLLQYGYFFIVILAFLRVIVSLYRIWQLYRQHPAEKLERIRFIRTLAPGTPFSFFRWLFWDDRIELHSAKGNQVFRHELFHIRQQHSIDIVCMEIITALGWLNPFFHLIKKELKAIHEFLADRFAVTENTKWEYAELLLMQAFNTRNSLVNPFFHNQIKRRIAMITNPSKPGSQYLRKLLALPLAALLMLLFAFNYKNSQQQEVALNNSATANLLPDDRMPSADTSKPTVETENKIFAKVEVESAFPGGLSQWRSFLEKNLNAGIPAGKGAPAGAYTVIIQFVVDKEGRVGDLRALTNHGYGMEAEALRVFKLSPNWIPARQNGKVVTAYRKQPVTFLVTEDHKSGTASPAKFPGGDAAWTQFLEKNLNARIPIENKAPDGVYKVLVEFLVDKKGNISNIKARTSHGFKMEEELERILKSSPAWIPATLNGKPVTSYHNQPVTFMVGNGKIVHGSPPPAENVLNEVVLVSFTKETDSKKADQPIAANDLYPSISLGKMKSSKPFELLQVSPDTEIIGYMFTTDLEDNRIAEAYNSGDQFSEATLKLINNLNAGRLVTLDLIKIKKDGKEIKIASKVYKIIP